MLKRYLFIKNSPNKGKGVFTNKKIMPESVIEISPVIVMEGEDRIHLDKTLMHDYIFEWGENNEKCCVALGYLSIYNHSYKSNCEYFMDFEEKTMMIKTVREILEGEELTLNYNGDWNDPKKIWFPTADM
ncbi:MAG: SET domain-containing protein-lysine N-methyltransferase [Ferruginibacter sp.]